MRGFSLCTDLEGDIHPYFDGDYSLERKWDGERVHIEIVNGKVRIYNRRFNSLTQRLPEVVEELTSLDDMVLDGEVVYLQGGIDDFNMAQRRCSTDNKLKVNILSRKYPVHVKVFDLLQIGNKPLTKTPYLERTKPLEEMLGGLSKASPVQQHISNKEDIWKQSIDEKWEGVVFKKLNGTYITGRNPHYIRAKHFKETTLIFNAYETNPAGITLINEDNIRVQCAGQQSQKAKIQIDQKGELTAQIQYMEKTKNGRYRMPTLRQIK